MSYFIEERLLECVEYGFSGGPVWNNKRWELRSGITRRKITRTRPMISLSASFNLGDEDKIKAVLNAFNACRGGAYSFRVKNWLDFELEGEVIGVASGASQSLQITKSYSFGDKTLTVPIKKPNNDIQVYSDDVLIASTVDTTTGIVTFTAPIGEEITVYGTFDTPMMFENDDFVSVIRNWNQQQISVNLIEDMAVYE